MSGTAAIEWIRHGEQALALIVPAGHEPSQSEFLSPDAHQQQVGFIVYPEHGEIVPHVHRELPRNLHGTSEVLLVRSGRCLVDFYLADRSFLCTRELKAGDLLALIGGGHGFRMLERTVLLEIKQGPYIGAHEKERFAPRPQ
jgi:hypothetical protein